MSRTSPRLSLDVFAESLPYKAPFRISGYTFTEVQVVIVVLSDLQRRGTGEAAGVYYLGDVPDRMLALIEAHRAEIESGISRQRLREIMPAGGARNAVDCALWDLEAKRTGIPVWRQAGLDRKKLLTTTFTLGAEDPAVMAAGAKAFSQARALKLKLTGDLDTDIERVRAVRAARPDVWMGVDANQGFTTDTLGRLVSILIDSGVKLLEQPLARGKEADMDVFDYPITVAADESVQVLADIEGLVGRFDAVNIKLDKCGGLTEALLMEAECRRLGLEVMVGNMVGSSWAMAPAFVLGQLCDVVDLDGPLFIAKDRAAAISYDTGIIDCADTIWGGPTT
ncbi:MAG: dipeptide epimerase [Proteobacteria bacterium]|nr:dipeptide epimerase [Pseudomonadota bacterium]MBS0421649.1 dipeptide epimerase [Pseudomonadota bacterium]